MGENGLKILKTEFPDNKWKFLSGKLAYPFEYVNSPDDYQKPVDNIKKEDFFSKLKINVLMMKKRNEKKKFFQIFDIKKVEELTQLKSDVLLLTCVLEKFIKVSTNEFGINPLCCVSLPGYTWQCGLEDTRKNLKTVEEKDLNLTLEKIIRGGISTVMGHRYVKSDENKKILYMDATNLYGHSMSQPLPYDEIEMWHGHTDLYMNKIEEILNTPVDSDIGYSFEVDLRYPDNKKEKTKSFPFVPVNKVIHKDKCNDYIKKVKPRNYTKAKKLICDWTDEKSYLVHYRILKNYF